MDAKHLKWLQGMLFVLAVALIWVVASYVVQSVEESGLAPFILTYICNSLFILYIPLVESVRFVRHHLKTKPVSIWQIFRLRKEEKPQAQEGTRGTKMHKSPSFADTLRALTVRSPSLNQWLPPSASSSSEDLALLDSSRPESSSISGAGIWTGGRWTRVRTMSVALLICPFWFFAQLTFNLSLNYTSVSSNTILSSTSTVFTFLVSMYFLGERFTIIKLLSVSFCLAGTAMVSIADAQQYPGDQGHNTVTGDLLCLLSALLYASYTALIRALTPAEGGQEEMGEITGAEVELPCHGVLSAMNSIGEDEELQDSVAASGNADDDEEAFSTALLFGYIGLWNLVLFLPVGLLLHLSGAQDYTWPTLHQWELVIGKGLLDNVLSDYLWARAVLLTTPTAATAGLQIQIPISITADSVMDHRLPHVLQLSGACLVLLGFIGINSGITGWNCENRMRRRKTERKGQPRVGSLASVTEEGN